MSSTVERISGNQVRLHFDIPAEQFETAIQKAYQKLRGKIRVPGFRPGKAPRKVIENMYGADIFYEDAFRISCRASHAHLTCSSVTKGEKLNLTVPVSIVPTL